VTTLEEVQTGLRLASKEVQAFLQSEPDVHAITPGGEWTIRDTAVHLICATRMYTMLLSDRPSPMRTAVEQPKSHASFLNAGFFLAMDEDRPRQLADLVERAVASFLDSTIGRDFANPVQYVGLPVSVGIMAGLQCFEYLLHGFDMARAVGTEWVCPESVADPALTTGGQLTTAFLDPAKATDLHASFAIEGGSERICCQVRAGTMEPLAANTDTDCSITGPSSQILLWLTGRIGWEDAGLSASGPRADLAPTLADKLVPLG
jgi:uncharacterized protein (TIGR03083 family)